MSKVLNNGKASVRTKKASEGFRFLTRAKEQKHEVC